jgi:hypothetical protein
MTVVLLTIAVFAAAMLLMAVGVLFKRGCLTGSCGGVALLEARTRSVRCPWCPLHDRTNEEVD